MPTSREPASELAQSQSLVFVDLDRCLLLDDSIGAFLARLVDRGLVPRSAIFRGIVAYIAYRLNLADPEAMIHRGIQHLTGQAESALQAEADIFFRDVVRFRYRNAVVDAIEDHQEAGRPVYLLTGGLPYVPQLVATDLKLDGSCSTEAETRDGKFTGRALEPPCAGSGKIVHAQRTAERLGKTLAGSWFYTDSFSDLPMLKVAAHPIAVNPDAKLERWARQHNWPIIR